MGWIHPAVSDMRSAKSGPNLWQIWLVFGPWASPYGTNGQITMTLHNYRSRQVHETLNGVNPSSRFRDMRSAKSVPNLWQIWQVFGPWASPYGANGQMTMTVHNCRPRQFHRTSNGENPSSGYRERYGFRKFGSRPPAHRPARTVTIDCFTLLFARHLADVSCYIGPSMPSGISMEIHTKIVQKRKKKQSRD